MQTLPPCCSLPRLHTARSPPRALPYNPQAQSWLLDLCGPVSTMQSAPRHANTIPTTLQTRHADTRSQPSHLLPLMSLDLRLAPCSTRPRHLHLLHHPLSASMPLCTPSSLSLGRCSRSRRCPVSWQPAPLTTAPHVLTPRGSLPYSSLLSPRTPGKRLPCPRLLKHTAFGATSSSFGAFPHRIRPPRYHWNLLHSRSLPLMAAFSRLAGVHLPPPLAAPLPSNARILRHPPSASSFHVATARCLPSSSLPPRHPHPRSPPRSFVVDTCLVSASASSPALVFVTIFFAPPLVSPGRLGPGAFHPPLFVASSSSPSRAASSSSPISPLLIVI